VLTTALALSIATWAATSYKVLYKFTGGADGGCPPTALSSTNSGISMAQPALVVRPGRVRSLSWSRSQAEPGRKPCCTALVVQTALHLRPL
jgi:hypothetical protein